MVKKSRLRAALDAHQGRDYQKERQLRLQKKAAKAKAKSSTNGEDVEGGAGAEESQGDDTNGVSERESKAVEALLNGEDEVDDESEEGDGPSLVDLSRIDDSESENESDEEMTLNGGAPLPNGAQAGSEDEDDEDGEDEDIPLSEIESLSSADRNDILPHQRLTINNTTALVKALKSIALPVEKLAFSEHQSITSSAATQIPDIEDDLNRELSFYAQSLEATKEARRLLKKEGQPFSRPKDYFAEMVKSDEHMGKIKQKLVDDAAGKKAAAEARRQRDLKKFGKQVQVAKLQERDKMKRETLDKINLLKRKRRSAPLTGTHEEEGGAGGARGDGEDIFGDISIDDSTPAANRKKKHASSGLSTGERTRNGNGNGESNRHGGSDNSAKRVKRDAKYGFGGKKRFSKSSDAVSSGDLSAFSARRMKGGEGRDGRGRERGRGRGGARRGGAGRGGAAGGGGRGGGGGAGGKQRLGKARRKSASFD